MNVHSIHEDRSGRLLIGGLGLLVLGPGGPRYYRSSEDLADNSIRSITETSDGAVWIGTISGLRKIEGGLAANPFRTSRLISNTNISVLRVSRTGQLWIGTYGQGLMLYREGDLVRFSAPARLPHNNVLSVFEDTEDDVWIGTQGGLLRLRPCAAHTITTPDDTPVSINTIYQDPLGPLLVTTLNGQLFEVQKLKLAPPRLPAFVRDLPVRNVFRDRQGALWIGTDGEGVARLEGQRVARYTMKQGLINDFVRAFCEDRQGGVWIGTDGGLSYWREGAFRNFGVQAGLAYQSIRALMLDQNGSLWIATDGGLSRFHQGAFVSDPRIAPLHGHKIWALYEDPVGGLWIGAQGAGLFLLKDGKLTNFTTKHGLPSNKIYFIAGDSRGALWMSGPAGIVSLSRRELEAVGRDGHGQLAVRLYSIAEGLSTNQMMGGVQSAGALALNGDLWFPSAKGAVRINPSIPDRAVTSPALIEQVLADDRSVALTEALRLPPGQGKLEIHYTAIRLSSPERLRFRYWMEGFDPDWTDAGQRRVAYYTNLPPGDYRFHVVAYEMNAPRSAAERVLAVEWAPHFYQTRWFLALCLLLLGAIAWVSYRVHARNLRHRFEAVLEERNRLAREMHDTLIQGCVGVSALLEAASQAQSVSPELSGQLMDRARTEVRAAVDDARTAVWNLRHDKPSGNGLVATVSQLTHRIGSETGLPVRFETSGAPLSLGDEGERNLVLLVREALNNAVRHAAPKNLSVRLRFEARALHVEIEDDGSGFDSSAEPPADDHHYGMVGMRERVARLGGRFLLQSTPGKGTNVRLSIPARKATK